MAPKVVWISGPTGVGKSTLASTFAKNGWHIVAEVVPPNLFSRFSADPKGSCFQLQESIIDSRIKQWKFLKDRAARIAFDRSLSEDIGVFAELHFRNGHLSKQELSRLRAKADVPSLIPQPQLIYYLRADVSTLRRRLVERGGPDSLLVSLQDQVKLYNEWAEKQPVPMQIVDAEEPLTYDSLQPEE